MLFTADDSHVDSNMHIIYERVNCATEDLFEIQRAVASVGVDEERDMKRAY